MVSPARRVLAHYQGRGLALVLDGKVVSVPLIRPRVGDMCGAGGEDLGLITTGGRGTRAANARSPT